MTKFLSMLNAYKALKVPGNMVLNAGHNLWFGLYSAFPETV